MTGKARRPFGFRQVALVTLVTAAGLVCSCRRDEPAATAPVAGSAADAAVALAAASRSITPGQPFTLGIDLKVPAGWHTYWQNPGDTGMAPAFQWRTPKGIRPAGIRFPVPARFEEHGIVSLGYEGSVRLLADFETEAALDTDTEQVEVTVSWMICRDVCVPVESTAGVTLPVSSGLPAAAGAGEEESFARWRQRLPEMPAGWRITATRTEAGLRLQVEPSPEEAGRSEGRWLAARVFPTRPGALDLGRSPAWRPQGAAWVTELTAGSSPYEAGDRFEAVLAFETAGQPVGWLVEADVAAKP